MPERFTIVGIGEALFDVIQGDRRLGGAPLNAAVHADQLGQAVGGRGVLVSRIGQDELGKRLMSELSERGLNTDYIQSDPDYATGRVLVRFDRRAEAGSAPQYEIARDAAWDMLWFDPDDEDLAMTADAICFGSLAQRTGQARNSIYRFLDASRHSVKLFDCNLRTDLSGKPFHDQRILQRSCQYANVVKLNEDELTELSATLGLSMAGPGPNDRGRWRDDDESADESIDARAIEELILRYELEMLVLTRGSRGTRLYLPGENQSSNEGLRIIDGEPAQYPPAENADGVGAGDACAAAILVGLVLHLRPQPIADLANHLGAYVASQCGAVPSLPESIPQRLTAYG